MYLVCLAMYASLVSTVPVSQGCQRMSRAQLSKVTAECTATAKDPLTTCEVIRTGALSFFITRRMGDS
jgi:hypothetical protein